MKWDAVVVGSGPNGLAAAIELARNGASVKVLERHPRPGGGTRTESLTEPGFLHDVCAAAHPMGVLSPYLSQLPLEQHGLQWLFPEYSVAHPLPHAPAVMLHRSMERSAAELDPEDGERWIQLLAPFVERSETLLADALGPLGLPRDPWTLARFGRHALRSASGFARRHFRGARARAVFAGMAAHSTLPLDAPLTAAMGLVFAVTAHTRPWPVVQGGTERLAEAMVSYLRSLGGTVACGVDVRSLADVPDSRVVLFDTDPRQLEAIAGEALPATYRRRLRRFRYGPGVFKVDYALDGPIPWTDPRVREASTVHLGGPLEALEASERAMWEGDAPLRPFVLLVQQSELDPSRAPAGCHTGYAYIHVPAGSDEDHTEALENQIEAFAPGFRDRVRARHTTTAAAFERYNPNWVGGAISGGVTDLFQTFNRPVTRLDPYRTPNPRLMICSASTPPGGGVHGMCGYHAARSALRRLGPSQS